MKILAIDPATKSGWAMNTNPVISGEWDCRIKKDESKGMKFIRMRAKLKEILKEDRPDLIVFERPGGRFNADIMSHASFNTVIQMFAIDHNIDYRAYSPGEIKKHATGKGNSGKPAMLAAAKEKLGYEGDNDNESDALWLLNLAESEYDL